MKKYLKNFTILIFFSFIVIFIKYENAIINRFATVFSKFSDVGYIAKKEGSTLLEKFSEYFYIVSKNQELSEENARLRQVILRLSNDRLMQDDLKKIYYSLKKHDAMLNLEKRFILGTLIKSYNSTYMFISLKECEIGDLVLSSGSVIGRIKSKNNGYYNVISVNHSEFKVRAFSLNRDCEKSEGMLLTENGECVFYPKDTKNEAFCIGNDVFVIMEDFMIYSIGKIKAFSKKDNKYIVSLYENYSSVGFVVKAHDNECKNDDKCHDTDQ